MKLAAAGAPIPDEYLSQVAHEMRGSLNTILGWAEILRRNVAADDATRRAAETIIRHARQQAWMVNEVVDTCRLASGTLVLFEASVLLDDIVQLAIDAVAPIAGAKSVSFNHQISSTAAGEPPRILGDARRLTQAFTTLLMNAVHFSVAGEVVDIEVDVGSDVVAVEIRDRGTGLEPPAVHHLFERDPPPSRAAGSPRRDFRTGLALVRDVIARHGGSIVAASEAGRGLTLRVELPRLGTGTTDDAAGGPRPSLREGRPAELGPSRDGGHSSGATSSRNGGGHPQSPPRTDVLSSHLPKHADTDLPLCGLRVLVVDDEPDARETLRGILTHYGAIVRVAASAADGVAILNREPMEVLLADIGMPGENGYDLIGSVRRLSARTASIPAVAVTAFTSDADRRRALDAGFQMHVAKPVEISALVALVADLGRRQQNTGA